MKEQIKTEALLLHMINVGRRFVTEQSCAADESIGKMMQFYGVVCIAAQQMTRLEEEMRNTLLNLCPMDYLSISAEVKGVLSMWEHKMSEVSVYKYRDYIKYPSLELDDVKAVKEKYNCLEQLIDGCFTGALQVDLKACAYNMYDIIRLALNTIFDKLCNLDRDYKMLNEDIQLRMRRWCKMEEVYLENCWERDKQRFLAALNNYLARYGDNKRTLEDFLNRVDLLATTCQPERLAILNYQSLHNDNYVKYVFANRNKLSSEDLMRHMSFCNCRKLLIQKIELCDLRQPVTGTFAALFTSRAAMELSDLLVKTIATYVDFRYGYQYSAWAMAMMDTGLIKADGRNNLPLMNYVNSRFAEEIKEQSTLSRWTGKLLGARFGTLDEHSLQRTDYSIEDFVKLKDYYWRTLSIINKVLCRNLKDEGYAEYLHEQHENTPELCNFIYNDAKGINERIDTLKLALGNRQS